MAVKRGIKVTIMSQHIYDTVEGDEAQNIWQAWLRYITGADQVSRGIIYNSMSMTGDPENKLPMAIAFENIYGIYISERTEEEVPDVVCES